MLREHAEGIRTSGAVSSGASERLGNHLLTELGSLAPDAVMIVEAYASGAPFAHAAKSGNEPDFGNGLSIVLKGIQAAIAAGNGGEGSDNAARPHVIQSELWQLLRIVRESADLAYSRENDLIELDRRIVFLLHSSGNRVPAEISASIGVDKAQVSRSVKRLLAQGLVSRHQIRAPLSLTAEGAVVAKRLARMAQLRNRELTIDVTDDELVKFYDTIEILLDRAATLYEQERELAHGAKADDDGRAADSALGERTVLDRSRVVAPLMTMSAYFSRSGALAFKRLTKLSNFEAFVLSEIGISAPIDWPSLAAQLARDHSQAARTVQSLVARRLVQRSGGEGRRHGMFSLTPDGHRLHKIILAAGEERSAFLLAPLSAFQRTAFLETFAKIRRNAAAQLERERAFAEI